MHSIAVSALSFCRNQSLKEQLKKKFPYSDICFRDEKKETLSEQEFCDFTKNANIALIGRESVNDAVLQQLPKLKCIAKYGVGLDNLDLTACKNHGLSVYHQPGVNASAVAEMTLGMMIALLRNISLSDRLMHEGKWIKNGGVDLSGKTVGIIGFGAIGSRVAKLLTAFSCPLLVCEIDPLKDSSIYAMGAKKVTLPELLKSSEIITLHVPLTPQTQNMLNFETLSLLRPHAYLINTARGELINEIQLKQLLKSQALAGAALDVYNQEPLRDLELMSLPNLVLTPHIAGNSLDAVLAMGTAAIEGIQKFMDFQSK